jgi:hypothetical protein
MIYGFIRQPKPPIKMKFTAKYLDSGFYTISDKAAGKINKNLPKRGYELTYQKIKLADNKIMDGVVLSRTSTCLLNKRGWSWAIHQIPYMGKKFEFFV